MPFLALSENLIFGKFCRSVFCWCKCIFLMDLQILEESRILRFFAMQPFGKVSFLANFLVLQMPLSEGADF